MKTITEKDLKVFCVSALVQNGMNEQDAAITADVLAGTDALGCFSHGTKNLRMYIEKIKVGALDPKAQPEVVKEGPAFALMDAHDAMGMVASVKGMAKAMDLAKKSGVGFVTMKNSCHFGAAGYYANMAAEQGMVGIAMSNTDPNMAVPGGKSMVVGNSPIAYAAPAKGHDPVMLDIAMSATAALKINQAKIKFKIHQIANLSTLRPPYIRLTMARVPMMAVNIDVKIPMDSVTAKPLTGPVPIL